MNGAFFTPILIKKQCFRGFSCQNLKAFSRPFVAVRGVSAALTGSCACQSVFALFAVKRAIVRKDGENEAPPSLRFIFDAIRMSTMAKLMAFTPDGSPYMQNVRVDNLSDGIWSSDEKHFWPEEGDMALDFFACAPSEYTYGPEGSAVTVPVLAQDDIAFTTNTKDSKKLEFDYTVPGSESGVTNAAERQPDIMFAYSACSRDNSSAGSVPLKFYHALAGVRFVTKDISAGTVKSITLKNLYGAGKCTYTYVFPDGNGSPDFSLF